MDRLIATGSVPLASADTAPTTGTPQYATNGNPATGTLATDFPAYAYNSLQDEIVNVILGAGLTPDRTKWNQLLTAIQTLMQSGVATYAVDTGAANAYVLPFSPAVTAIAGGAIRCFLVKTANTGASTLQENALPPEPLIGSGGVPLQGGELIAGGTAIYTWSAQYASYVLLGCTGGALQVAPATASRHAVQLGQLTSTTSPLALATTEATSANQAVNLGQFGSSVATAGYQKLPSGLIIQLGSYSTNGTQSGSAVTFPLAFPTACVSVSLAAGTNGNVLPLGTADSLAAVPTKNGFTVIGLQIGSDSANLSSHNSYYIAIGY